jgi:hypothetical protein
VTERLIRSPAAIGVLQVKPEDVVPYHALRLRMLREGFGHCPFAASGRGRRWHY